jgi:hypothetical protein
MRDNTEATTRAARRVNFILGMVIMDEKVDLFGSSFGAPIDSGLIL